MPDPIKNVVTVGLVLLLSLTGCGGGSKGNLGLVPNNAPTSLQLNEVASSDYESNRLNNTPTADFRVTGFYAPAHTQLKLQVKGEPAASSALNLLVGTYSRYNNGQDLGLFKLNRGENILNVGDAGGLVYVQYTVDAYPTRTHALTLTFGEGFVPTPHYVLGKTTKADWKNQLKTYTSTPDVVMESKRSFMVFSRENALRWQDNDQDSVLKAADQILDAEDAISGLDGSSEIHRRNTNQFLMTQAEDGWMYATNFRVAFSEGAAPYAFTPLITGKLPDSGDAWGVWHELGHLHQQAWTWDALGEVSVNIYALAAERSLGVKPPRLVINDVWTAISNHLGNTDANKDFNADSVDVFVRRGMFQQLWIAYGDNFYHQLQKKTREDKPALNTDAEKMRYFMLKACAISGQNLTGFFKKWGLQADAVYREIAAMRLPAPTTDPSTLQD